MFSTGCNPHVLGWRPQPRVSSLQLDVGCPVVIAAAIPDAMLLPTDECFAQEVHELVYDGLTCPKYVESGSFRPDYLFAPGRFAPLNRYYIMIDEVFFDNVLVIIFLLVVCKKIIIHSFWTTLIIYLLVVYKKK
jgi:hypothetical protein